MHDVQSLKPQLFDQKDISDNCLPLQCTISIEAKDILFQQYQNLIFAMYSPPTNVRKDKQSEYVLACLDSWKKEIMWMGNYFDRTIQDDKIVNHLEGLDVVVMESFTIPPLILNI
jgi:hypothetical protein